MRLPRRAFLVALRFGLVGLVGLSGLASFACVASDGRAPDSLASADDWVGPVEVSELSGVADLLIEDVTVIDAAAGRHEGQWIAIAGDCIVWVGQEGEAAPPARETIDGRGRFLIPGLFDAHVHFLYDERLTESMPDLFLSFGVTSVRDTGGDLERLVALREEWGRSGRAHPRMFIAGPLLDGAHVVYDGGTASQPPLGVANANPAMAQNRVREMHAAGADLIKIYELVSPRVFDALVETARELGLPIASHVPLSMTADRAGPKVDSMEHLRNIELACAKNWASMLARRQQAIAEFDGPRGFELRKSLHEAQRYAAIREYDRDRCGQVIESLRGTMQVPTLRLNAFNRSQPFRSGVFRKAIEQLPEPVQSAWREKISEFQDQADWDLRFADWSLRLTGDLHAAGVPIAAGTDTPIRLAIPGESLHRELSLLVEGGLSPEQALASATIEPARFFGLEDEMGQVATGYRADLVLLSRDPLASISNTRSIEAVISRGRRVPRSR